MQLKLCTLVVTFCRLTNVLSTDGGDNFFVVSTKKPPTEYQNVDARLSRLEVYLEMRSAIQILQESITELQKTKHDYIQEMQATLDKQLQLHNEEMLSLKKELSAVREEIISQNERNMQKMNEMKQALKIELDKRTENDQNTQKYLQDIKNEILDIKEKCSTNDSLETINKQLVNIASEVQDKNLPQDCKQVQKTGNRKSGLYRIHPLNAFTDFLVWCDMDTEGGGWTYVLNRFDGSQNFYLNWTDYKLGFGKLSGEHWLGLEHIHELTSNKPSELLFELVDWDSKKVYAKYTNFKLGAESEDYVIKSLGVYSGDAGDSFGNHVNVTFSTVDHGLNNHTSLDCASYFKGAWWYYKNSCYHVHLTGVYLDKPSTSTVANAIHWYKFHGYKYSLKEARMMIRPRED